MFKRFFQKRSGREPAVPGPAHQTFLPGGSQVGIVRNDLSRTRVTRAMNGARTFDLHRDPENSFHSNAIKVFLDGRHIGYTTYGYAEGLSPILDRLGLSHVRCEGIINASRGEDVGRLDAADPGVLRNWLRDGHQLSDRDPGQITIERHTLPVKRPKPYQSELERVLGQGRAEVNVQVTFQIETTPKGKYAGEPHIYVLHKGNRIGELPAQYRHQDENHENVYGLILNGGLPGCSARLQRTEGGLILVRLFAVLPSWHR